MTVDEKLAVLNYRRRCIDRYEWLLKTQLTATERQFIEKRLSAERAARDALATSLSAAIQMTEENVSAQRSSEQEEAHA